MMLQSVGQTDPGQVHVSFYASADTTITTSDYFLGRVDRWLTVGAAPTLTLETAFPTTIPQGSYYVGWIIDPQNKYAEGNEDNNVGVESSVKLKVIDPSKPTIYVDVNARGTNDGSSWKNAFTSLQDGLAIAVAGREVRIADGTYTPDKGIGITRGDRQAGFELSSGVIVLGGYAGVGEPNPDARDPKLHATILSGDLDSNDLPVADPCNLWKAASRTANSRHVIRVADANHVTVLDGVQVTGGYANAPSGANALAGDSQGAGLYLTSGNVSLRQCVFSGNWAQGDGGALYAVHGRLEVLDCTFRANGAGRFVVTPAGVSSSALTGTLQAQGTGGAIRSDGNGQITLSQCRFDNNFAGAQGGALDNDKGDLAITKCLFLRNRAGSSGGGAIWNSEGRLNAVSCTFTGNRSDSSGGAIANGWGAGLHLADCCLNANYSKVQAGAIDNFFGGKATLWNCTLAANRQDGNLGTIVCGPSLDKAGGELTIANSILWNSGSEISNQGKSLVTVTHTDVRGGWPGEHNLNADPRFALPAGLDGVAGTEDDDVRLGTGSPCIDSGDTALLPADFADLDDDADLKELLPVDLDGKARVGGAAVDMGAYESACSG